MAESPAPSKGEQNKAAPKQLYRFTYPFPCWYDAPLNRNVELGEEIEWPDGPPDPNWEPVDPKAEKAESAFDKKGAQEN